MDISKYQNVITKLDSKEAVLAYLIHLGYLSYREITANSGEICIPNEEVRQEFIKRFFKTFIAWIDCHIHTPILDLIIYSKSKKN